MAQDACPLDWWSDGRNAVCDLSSLEAVSHRPWPPRLADLVELAAATYLADVAALRGAHAEWVRDITLEVPVSDVAFWEETLPDLTHLLYTLSRDNITVEFRPDGERKWSGTAVQPAAVDCVCLLSGGLDSFAGAAMLLRAGRRPLLVSHQSGNATVEAAQRQVVAELNRLAPGAVSWVGLSIAPFRAGGRSLPFPPPDKRETSRRLRSLLFMALGALAAYACEVTEVYLCENGVLTAALPLTPARCGGLTTRSTHPMAIELFSGILQRAGIACEIINPFVYQTKSEMIRTVLKPLFPPPVIERTVSCWAAGRQNRQCGGCVPCLLRRLAVLSAGLPDEAYMMDVLRTPEQYRGTDAYGNLTDLLTQAAVLLTRTDFDLLLEYPQLLDLEAAGASVEDTLKTLRRHAAEVQHVLLTHFPASAALLGRYATPQW